MGLLANTGGTDQGGEQNEVVTWWVYFLGFFLPMPLDHLLRLPFILRHKLATKNSNDGEKEPM